jgi:hypothetical protein
MGAKWNNNSEPQSATRVLSMIYCYFSFREKRACKYNVKPFIEIIVRDVNIILTIIVTILHFTVFYLVKYIILPHIIL